MNVFDIPVNEDLYVCVLPEFSADKHYFLKTLDLQLACNLAVQKRDETGRTVWVMNEKGDVYAYVNKDGELEVFE